MNNFELFLTVLSWFAVVRFMVMSTQIAYYNIHARVTKKALSTKVSKIEFDNNYHVAFIAVMWLYVYYKDYYINLL